MEQTKEELDPEILAHSATLDQAANNSLTLDFSESERNQMKEYEVGIGNMSPIGPVQGKNSFVTSPFARKEMESKSQN